jgi:transcriptional regulator GlxA family with amidase domain
MAIDVMTEHLEERLSVGELGRRVNLSPSRFAHLFRHEIGYGPARYLRELRLDRARALVEESTLSIKEIMARVGFNDPSHFTRDFRRRHGASPRKIRARARSPGNIPERRQMSSTIRLGKDRSDDIVRHAAWIVTSRMRAQLRRVQ